MRKKISTIGLVSPADWQEPELIEQGVADLERRGYRVKVHPACFERQGRFAGADKVRAGAMMDFYQDPDVDLLLAAKGGYGSIRLLDLLDYETIKANPKPLCGSSDITTIINAIYAKTGQHGFISPVISDFAKGKSKQGLDDFLEAIEAGFTPPAHIGGNLATFMSLMGTPYLPSFTDKILVLEEIAEPVYKIDRWFQQLWMAGLLQQLSGMKIGWFKNIGDSSVRPSGFSVDDCLDGLAAKLPYSIERGIPFGHGSDSQTFRIG